MLPIVGNMLAMQLIAYLKERGESVPDFASRIGEPVGTIHKIAYRQRQPSLTLALKIASETGDEVTPADLALTDDASVPGAESSHPTNREKAA